MLKPIYSVCLLFFFVFSGLQFTDLFGASGPPYKFNFQETIIPVGETACMDVVVENFVDISAFQFGFKYDTSSFQFIGIESSQFEGSSIFADEAANMDGIPIVTAGYIELGPLTNIADSTVAFSFCFKAIGVLGAESELEISNLSNGNLSTIFADGIQHLEPDFCLVPAKLIIGEPMPPIIDTLGFELGTTWMYDGIDIVLERDTLIGGNTWYSLSELSVCSRDLQEFWLRKKGEIMWMHDPEVNQEFLLYDFSKQAGESWEIVMPNGAPKHTVIVDSVSIEEVDGRLIQVQYVHADPYFSAYDFGNKIYNGIGSSHYLFPTGNLCEGPNGLCSFATQSQSIEISSEFDCIPLSVLNKNAAQIELFPNPNNGSFQIQGIDNYESLEIYNINGSLVKRYDSYTAQINMDRSGMYLLKIDLGDGVVVSKKVSCIK